MGNRVCVVCLFSENTRQTSIKFRFRSPNKRRQTNLLLALTSSNISYRHVLNCISLRCTVHEKFLDMMKI